MDILKSFILDGTKFNFNVLWEDETAFFRASEIGEILQLTKNDFNKYEKVEKEIQTSDGIIKELFISESGLYRILLNSQKPIAMPFQMWVTDVITSIYKTGRYQLNQYMKGELQNNLQALQNEMIHYKEILRNQKNEIYIEAFEKRAVVYFGKINDLIKISSTENIQETIEYNIKEFGNFEIIKIIECGCNGEFERFLRTHKDIFKFKEEKYDMYKLTDEELEKTLNIAQHNVYKFRNMGSNLTRIQIEKIKLDQQIRELLNEQQYNNSKEIITTPLPIERVAEKLQNEDPNYIDPVILFADTRKFTQGRGFKVQRYTPDGKTLLQTYESAICALRDTSLDSPSRTRINEAVKNNTVYKDYRWTLLDRKLPDDTHQELEETVYEVIDIRKGFVAMLNLDKNQIVKVFKHQKYAGIDRKFKSSAPICSAIKNGTQSGGFYFKMWYNCSDELQSEYLSRESLPEKYVGGGQRIAKLHPVTGNTMKVYSSIAEVTKEFRFSRASLFNAIENEFISKGYRWTLASSP